MKKTFDIYVPRKVWNKDKTDYRYDLNSTTLVDRLSLEACPICGGHPRVTRDPAIGECVGHQGVIGWTKR